MAENYKHLYEQTKKMLTMYQDELIPGFRKTIADLEAKSKWISVKERLPEKGGSYLVFSSKSKTVFTSHYWLGDRWANRANGQFITHWMEMPMPPKEKNNA